MRPRASNESNHDMSYGIFQINIKGNLARNRPTKEQLFDYKINIDFAYEMFKSQGWQPWSCKRVL